VQQQQRPQGWMCLHGQKRHPSQQQRPASQPWKCPLQQPCGMRQQQQEEEQQQVLGTAATAVLLLVRERQRPLAVLQAL